MKPQFHGSYFGNLAAGMNVSYSSDPYWGEKMAAAYRHLDEAFGSPDYGRCRISYRPDRSPDDAPDLKSSDRRYGSAFH